ncbi:MAG: peptide-methionine (S)-S-oxide reductase MsrA [Gemmatimonadota bacterium]
MSGAKTETSTLGGGCFWCLDAIFRQLQGVQAVASGYAGGTAPDPTYEQVCTGATGHAEVVRVTYDPDELPYSELLEIFFAIHDPTTLNRQGGDVGTQYRSIILTESEEQARVAREMKTALEADGPWEDPIVTAIEPLERFWPAEAYHENYLARNPEQAYCQAVINPKVAKFRQKFAHRLKSS